MIQSRLFILFCVENIVFRKKLARLPELSRDTRRPKKDAETSWKGIWETWKAFVFLAVFQKCRFPSNRKEIALEKRA